jgi:hypothetical protein
LRAENGKMGHMRTRGLTEAESRCFRCDRFERGFWRTSRPNRSLSEIV